MNRKIFLSVLFILTTVFVSFGQGTDKEFMNGFHLGIVAEPVLSQKTSVNPLGTSQLAIHGKTGFGWATGIEFSYHFSKYFGVSVGLNYGTSTVIRLYGDYIKENNINGHLSLKNLQIPVRFAFHSQIGESNFIFFGFTGVCFHNFVQPVTHILQSTDYANIELFDNNKIHLRIDFQIGTGFYYRLPYNDLLRFNLKANIAFKDNYKGFASDMSSVQKLYSLSSRNNNLGIEISYIHCFRKKSKH